MEFDDGTLVAPPPFVEVELVYEKGRPGLSGAGYCALAIWTQNTIYEVDWSMRCFRVTNRATEQPVASHPFLTARLTGGQRQDSSGPLELTYPVPRPGSIAVFELPDRYVTTSEVTRVVLRVRVISVEEPEQAKPLWDTLSISDE